MGSVWGPFRGPRLRLRSGLPELRGPRRKPVPVTLVSRRRATVSGAGRGGPHPAARRAAWSSGILWDRPKMPLVVLQTETTTFSRFHLSIYKNIILMVVGSCWNPFWGDVLRTTSIASHTMRRYPTVMRLPSRAPREPWDALGSGSKRTGGQSHPGFSHQK